MNPSFSAGMIAQIAPESVVYRVRGITGSFRHCACPLPGRAMLSRLSFRNTGRAVQGLWTVYRRRGFWYLVRLVTGYARLQALYRFAWGPRAPQPARILFAVLSVLATRAPSDIDCFAAGMSSS